MSGRGYVALDPTYGVIRNLLALSRNLSALSSLAIYIASKSHAYQDRLIRFTEFNDVYNIQELWSASNKARELILGMRSSLSFTNTKEKTRRLARNTSGLIDIIIAGHDHFYRHRVTNEVLHLRDMMRSVDSSKIVAASSFPSHFKEHTERFAFKTQNDL
ncbi:hypothetical protein E2P81_ATG03517 [Venturia nashicola]|nr:hypothetical protein E2P81_ATG03517 [Venturia nashicola]